MLALHITKDDEKHSTHVHDCSQVESATFLSLTGSLLSMQSTLLLQASWFAEMIVSDSAASPDAVAYICHGVCYFGTMSSHLSLHLLHFSYKKLC